MRRTGYEWAGMLPSERALHRSALFLVALLAGLALTGFGGFLLFGAKAAQAGKGQVVQQPTSVFAPLPPLEFALAEGSRIRQVDIDVVLELPPGVDKQQFNSRIPRIVNALNARMVELDPNDLRGPLGTQMVKDVVSVAANRELRPIRVSQVLLQKLVLY
ncbi:MAG TPA: flagellar basal body-associated FliL family protein [Azospirillum sp.]|nr:flagellar basal body-associated FliL family protein [Azospirillum sp.]